jgi:hypothetical protein
MANGREALALLASLEERCACPVRRLRERMPAPMIDLAARI